MEECKKAISRHLAVADISCFWWSGDPRFRFSMLQFILLKKPRILQP